MSNKSKRNNSGITKNIIILSSLAYFVLGITMIVFSPTDVRNFLRFALGSALTIYGLFNIVSFFTDKENKRMLFELLFGIFATALGIFAFTVYKSFDIVVKIIGIIIIIDSIMDIKYSFDLKKYGLKRWKISLLVSLLLIALSCIILFFTKFFADNIILLGIIMIYVGLSGLIMRFTLGYFERRYEKNPNMIEAKATDRE